MTCTLTKCHSNDQTKKNVICGICDTYRGEGRCTRGFDEETWQMKTTSKSKT